MMKHAKATTKTNAKRNQKATKREIGTWVRVIISWIASVISVLAFFGMITVNADAAGWWKWELLFLAIFIFSIAVNGIAHDPNLIIRHLFAMLMCSLAFAYRRLHIRNEVTYDCNRMRRKLDGYPQLYMKSLEIYDDKLYREFEFYGDDMYDEE